MAMLVVQKQDAAKYVVSLNHPDPDLIRDNSVQLEFSGFM
jgi:hypothetical protein